MRRSDSEEDCEATAYIATKKVQFNYNNWVDSNQT